VHLLHTYKSSVGSSTEQCTYSRGGLSICLFIHTGCLYSPDNNIGQDNMLIFLLPASTRAKGNTSISGDRLGRCGVVLVRNCFYRYSEMVLFTLHGREWGGRKRYVRME
jgi:hypothetical protein